MSDEYSLFCLKFIEGARAAGAGTWLRPSQTPSYTSWSCFAFESVCQKHVNTIKHAPGIAGVYTEASGWRYAPGKGEKGAQVDMLIYRADHCINLCEMKFFAGIQGPNKNEKNDLSNHDHYVWNETEYLLHRPNRFRDNHGGPVQMTALNWSIFKTKFHLREQASFESLAYMLFCYEHGIANGIFRFNWLHYRFVRDEFYLPQSWQVL